MPSGPVIHRGLQDADLAPVRVREHVPQPSALLERLVCQAYGPGAHYPLHLSGQVACPKIQVHSVLASLAVGYLLQQQLRAAVRPGKQAEVRPERLADPAIAKDLCPEVCRSIEVLAVKDDSHLAGLGSPAPAQARTGPTHDLFAEWRPAPGCRVEQMARVGVSGSAGGRTGAVRLQLPAEVHVRRAGYWQALDAAGLHIAVQLIEARRLEAEGRDDDLVAAALLSCVLSSIKQPSAPALAPCILAHPDQTDPGARSPGPAGQSSNDFAALIEDLDAHLPLLARVDRGSVVRLEPSREHGLQLGVGVADQQSSPDRAFRGHVHAVTVATDPGRPASRSSCGDEGWGSAAGQR